MLIVFIFFLSCSKSSEEANLQGNSASSVEMVQVTWYDYEKGVKIAAEKGKPVIIDLFADWCGWCKKMDLEVFSDSEVSKKLNEDYICVRLHMDRNNEEMIRYKGHVLTKQEFAVMHGVQGLPTMIFMDRTGNIAQVIPGYINKTRFIPILNFIRDECYLKKIDFRDYEAGKVACTKNK
jgi:thioredoxin-related protein